MMILAKIGDTPDKIAARFKGQRPGKKELAHAIREENKKSLSWPAFSGDFYAPRYPVWIPSIKDPDAFERLHMMSYLQGIPEIALDHLEYLLQCQIDPMILARARDLAIYANHRMASGPDAAAFPWLGLALDKTAEFVAAGLDYKGDHLIKFTDSVDAVSKAMARFKNLNQLSDLNDEAKALTQTAKTEFQAAFDRLQASFQADLQQFALERDALLVEYRDFEYLALKETLIVNNIKEVEKISKVGYYLKYAGKAYALLQATDYFIQVKDAYEKDGRWLRDAIEDLLKLLVTAAVPIIIGIMFVGGGWVVVLAAAGTDVILNTAFDGLIDYTGNKVDS